MAKEEQIRRALEDVRDSTLVLQQLIDDMVYDDDARFVLSRQLDYVLKDIKSAYKAVEE